NPGNQASLWTVNDTWTGAELQAPVSTYAFLSDIQAGSHLITLNASEFPWYPAEDTAIYKVGAETTLVTLQGNLAVAGSAPTSSSSNDTTDYVLVGVNGGVPAIGSDAVIASRQFTVPPGHSGVVMMTAKSRVQGDGADQGGTVSLWLVLDGQPVGN